jgi:hypothetical protein
MMKNEIFFSHFNPNPFHLNKIATENLEKNIKILVYRVFDSPELLNYITTFVIKG